MTELYGHLRIKSLWKNVLFLWIGMFLINEIIISYKLATICGLLACGSTNVTSKPLSQNFQVIYVDMDQLIYLFIYFNNIHIIFILEEK